MNYHNITHDDMLNGKGLRVVLWVAGCEHHCPHCHNPQTHDINSGIVFDDRAKSELFSYLAKPYTQGLTLSGGDPLHTNNRNSVYTLIEQVHEKFPDKDIWLYTGYEWNEIKELPLMKFINVLVDSKFIIKLKDAGLHWRGSSNQHVIDVQKSLQLQQIVNIP